jgi:hypothetical protein
MLKQKIGSGSVVMKQSPNIRVESDAVKRRTVSYCLGAGAAHAER